MEHTECHAQPTVFFFVTFIFFAGIWGKIQRRCLVHRNMVMQRLNITAERVNVRLLTPFSFFHLCRVIQNVNF